MDSRLLNPDPENKLDSSLSLSTPLQQASQMWPFTPMYLTRGQFKEQLIAQLPTWERANSLCEAWLENLSWFHRPVKRSQIFEDLLPAAYRRTKSGTVSITVEEEIDVHDLALLFSVFACGATADLTLPVWNSEAETFQQLARAALGLRSVFDASSITAAQAICMLGSFDIISGRKNSLESAWKTTSFSFMLALSVRSPFITSPPRVLTVRLRRWDFVSTFNGFLFCVFIGSLLSDRDPARWGLDSKEVQLRRSVFWEMNLLDNWKVREN